MSNPPQDKNVSVRDINLINEEWRRQLVGRKYVKHEDDGFNGLKCLRKLKLSDEIIRIIASYYCFTASSANLPSGLNLMVVTYDDLDETSYYPDRLRFLVNRKGFVDYVEFGH